MEGVFCSNSEWGLKLAVETDRHKRVSIHTGSKILTLPAEAYPDHIHQVRVKVGHSNPNLNPNPNPKDRGVTVLILYIPADSLQSM